MELDYTCHARSARESYETPVVFVVDPDISMRDVLESWIRSLGWIPKLAASGEEFLAQSQNTAPCCLLVELTLPHLSGLDLQRLVLDRSEMPIIFMSRQADSKSIVQAMKAGALEFLTKPISGDALLSVMQQAIERSGAELRRSALVRNLQERYESLSRRQREVMCRVVSGQLNKQVGSELGISEITVKAHRGIMMRKMRADSFAELVSMALRLDPTPPIQDA